MTALIGERQHQALLARAGRGPVTLAVCFRGAETEADRRRLRDTAPAGACRHDLTCRELVVGDGALPWAAVQLYAHADAEAALAFAQRAADAAAVTEILALRPAPARLRRMVAAIRWVCRWLPAPARNVDPETLVAFGGINPTRASLDALERQPPRPVEMINLLKFHADTRYPEGGPGGSGGSGGSGAAAYQRYGKVAMTTVFRLGGSLSFIGRYLTTLAGADGAPREDVWDEVAIMRYPRPAAFLHMIHNRRYCQALRHRDAGLADTALIASHAATQAEGAGG